MTLRGCEMNFQPVIDAFAQILLNQIGPVGVVALLGAVAMWFDRREQTKVLGQAIEKMGAQMSQALMQSNAATTSALDKTSAVIERLTDRMYEGRK